MEPFHRGKLLVANPAMEDPNFSRTVVLLLDHDEGGALGVILNRPSATEVGEVLPEWAAVTAPPAVVFGGGPVAPEAAIGVAHAPAAPVVDGWSPLVEGVGTIDLARSPGDIPVRLHAVRIYAGYAGWSPGQLEGEVDAGAWLVVDATLPEDLMASDPEAQWAAVLRRQGGTTAWLAAFPEDPSLN